MTTIDDRTAACFKDTQSFGTLLIALAIDVYGSSILDYEPETLIKQIETDFAIKMPQVNKDKLLAAMTVLTTDSFKTSVFTFNELCDVLNNNVADFSTFEPVGLEKVGWGLAEANLLNPPLTKDPGMEYSDDIRVYIGTLMEQEGIRRPVSALAIAVQSSPEVDATSIAQEPDSVFEQARYQKETEQVDSIVNYINEHIIQLVKQLDSAPFRNRNRDTWTDFSTNVLKQSV